MYNCVERGQENERRYLESITCGMRELERSHGGGNDYSAPCVLHVNEHGKHKGKHRTKSGYTWTPNEYDRKL